MADADQQDTTSSDQIESVDTPANQGTSKVEAELAKVQTMLEQMNQGFAAMAQAAVTKNKPVEEEVDPVYDPKRYRQQLLNEAEEIARRQVARERELNTVVYQMAQEYPEISTDANLKRAITEAQRALPEGFRETAAGYEAAILKAVNKAGLLPKAKRQAPIDEDVAMGSGRSSSRPQPKGKAKISPEALELAQLLGRDINDPKVLAGLEAASKRQKWSSWE